MNTAKSPRNRPRGGYSLIELLIASTFLVVGITGTLVVNTAAHSLRRTAAETRAATAVLGNLIETMRPLSADDVAEDYAEGVEIAVEESILNEAVVVVDHNGFAAGDTSLELSLTASWITFSGSERSITFDTAF